MKRSLLTLSLLALSAPVFAGGPELQPLREIAIQDGGRTKPLDSFARELARRVQGARAFGFETVAGLEPTEWVLATLAAPDRWKAEPIVKVTHAGLRQAAGLPSDKDRYSFQELADHKGLAGGGGAGPGEAGPQRGPRPGRARGARPLRPPDHLPGRHVGRVAPHRPPPRRPEGRLVLARRPRDAADGGHPPGAARPRAGERDRSWPTARATGRRSRPRPPPSAAASPSSPPVSTRREGPRAGGPLQPGSSRSAPPGSSTSSASSPCSRASRSPRGASRGRAWRLVVAGFLFHAYGMALRVLISGRPPVTNMYESVVWVAFGGMLFALVFEAVYRVRFFAACASALAVVCLILADNVPILDGSISPLVPVLRDNMWLTVHVLTITLGYAAFTLAMGIGHLNLGPLLLPPRRGGPLQEPLALPLPRAAGGDALPRGGDAPRRRVGLVLVGPLLGLGPEGDLGPHRDPRLPGDPARPHDGLDQGLRDGGGLAPRLPAGADGLVRRQLRPRHRAFTPTASAPAATGTSAASWPSR